MVLQHFPQIASISKTSIPLEEHVLIQVQDPIQPLGASNPFPPKINTRIWKKKKVNAPKPSPTTPFRRHNQWPPSPKFPSRCEPFQIAWSLLWRSLPKSKISRSRTLIISVERSIEALNLLPSRFQRLILSNSALRRRCFVSILSQSLHFWVTGTVCMMSFIPHVSPVRYSLLQCCRKCPHFQSPQANRCWSKKHMFDFFWAFWYPIVSVISYYDSTAMTYLLEKFISFYGILSLSSATQASKLSCLANVSGSFVNNDKGKWSNLWKEKPHDWCQRDSEEWLLNGSRFLKT